MTDTLSCPECGSVSLCGLYSRERDVTVAWACLDCGHAWERFGTGDAWHERMKPHADGAIAAWREEQDR